MNFKELWRKVRWSYRYGLIDDIIHPFRTIRWFFSRVWNILRWVPVLWKQDVDWDWTSLMDIYAFKLRKMADSFEKHSRHTDADRDVKHMRICAELCKRIRKDEYADWKSEELHELRGDFVFVKKDNFYTHEYPNSKISDEEYHKRLKEMFAYSERMYKQDIDLLFKLHRKYLQHWWD
jgi:hypothetical protein